MLKSRPGLMPSSIALMSLCSSSGLSYDDDEDEEEEERKEDMMRLLKGGKLTFALSRIPGPAYNPSGYVLSAVVIR
ncbi:Uncharacterised protein [Raoultella terrigena]|uniref:Uncharacterized protein n=1 Tax=Raoultella terrigena TaxID=577 RepID=A0A4U9D4W3_RAOTE|nr:Uncharacterised protein [Raoultella terrigena]